MARLLLLLSVFTATAANLQAGVLTQGSLDVTIGPNGAFQSVEFAGTNFFAPGHRVSNFGIQRGTDPSTFLLNDTYGGAGLALSESGLNYQGTHAWGSDTLHYLRSYSLVAGVNALRITSTITNTGTTGFTISQFDTFDPDQAYEDLAPLFPFSLVPFQTFNDVIDLMGVRVGQASVNLPSNELTMIVGSLDARAVVASGAPLQIGSGNDLNKFFNQPSDAEKLEDEGTHIGFRQFLNPGESTTFRYIMAFGSNPQNAQSAFTLAAVPEPSSIAVFGVVGLSVFFLRRRF